MCLDFTGLNKSYPKDDFPSPRIDRIVDFTSGCDYLTLLDAYSSYHQIRMHPEDEEKNSFITLFGVYCYVTMPFRLNNVGATYQ